jgi:hypothetical protein
MGFATVSDVSARDRGREPFTANTKPNTTEVVGFINYTAAVIEAKLRSRGYTVPVPATATSALELLKAINADGAACQVQKAATNSDRKEDYCKAWENAMELLEILDLDIPLDPTDAGTVSYDVGSSVFTMDLAGTDPQYRW